jgi:hypothetical protein
MFQPIPNRKVTVENRLPFQLIFSQFSVLSVETEFFIRIWLFKILADPLIYVVLCCNKLMGLSHEMDLALRTCMVSFRPKWGTRPVLNFLGAPMI